MNQNNNVESEKIENYIAKILDAHQFERDIRVDVTQFSVIEIRKFLSSTLKVPSKIMFMFNDFSTLRDLDESTIELKEIIEPKEKLIHITKTFLESTNTRLMYTDENEKKEDFLKLTTAATINKVYRYDVGDAGEPLGLVLEIPYFLDEKDVRLIGWVWRSENATQIQADGFRSSLLNYIRKDKTTMISFIHPWNQRSISMHRKIGFKESYLIYRK